MAVDEQQYNDSVATLTSAINETFPSADTRIGTPVRDLVLNPGGLSHATAISAADDISESADLRNGVEADEVLVDGLLRNLGVDRREQANAIGEARIVLDTPVDFAIPAGYILRFDAVTYETTSELTVGTDTSITADLYLAPYTNTDLSPGALYSVIVPVIATNGGAEGNIQSGAALTVDHLLTPYTQWQLAAADFTGGSEGETVEESLARAERQIGQQSMSSAPAIDGLLQTINEQVTSTGVIRSTDLEMQRNKRNVFGIAVGSYVDVYVRDFAQATTASVVVDGTYVSDGVYVATFAAPGWMNLAYTSTTEPFDTNNSTTSEVVRFAMEDGGHEIQKDNQLDVYGTMFQYMTVTLSGVAAVLVDGVHAYPATLPLYIGAYVSPGITLLQSSVDSSTYQSNTTDHLLHAPYLAVTSVKLKGRNTTGSTATIDELTTAALNIINKVPIGDTLAVADITSALNDLGVTVTSDVSLIGKIRDAHNVTHTLSGSELIPDSLGQQSNALSNKTVTFTSTASLIELDISDTRR